MHRSFVEADRLRRKNTNFINKSYVMLGKQNCQDNMSVAQTFYRTSATASGLGLGSQKTHAFDAENKSNYEI